MQTSRVNGLTSGVFAFLVPASCLNQKGSDTRRDNTTFPVADYYLHFPLFTTEKKTGFPLPAGNHLPGVFGWSGYSCLVISKIIAINSGKIIVHNLVMNITLIFP